LAVSGCWFDSSHSRLADFYQHLWLATGADFAQRDLLFRDGLVQINALAEPLTHFIWLAPGRIAQEFVTSDGNVARSIDAYPHFSWGDLENV